MNFAKFLKTRFLTEHLRWLLLYKQITEYMDAKFLKCLTGFRENHDTQLLSTQYDKTLSITFGCRIHVGTVLWIYQKAFVTLNQNLLLARSSAYGFKLRSAKLLHYFLANGKELLQVHLKNLF